MIYLVIQAYKQAEHVIKRHWSSYLRSGATLVGYECENEPINWPSKITTISHGKNSYIDKCILPERLIYAFEWFVENCNMNDHLFFTEHDSIFLKPIPKKMNGIEAFKAGDCPPEWNVKARSFYHVPYWCEWMYACLIAQTGRLLLDHDQCENGSPDVFMGRIFDELGFAPKTSNTFSCNSNDMREPRIFAQATMAKANGAFMIHGVKEPYHHAVLFS